MSKIIFIVGVLCVLQFVNGRVIRDAPALPTVTFDDISKKADEAVTTLHTNFLAFMGVKNDAEFRSLVQDKSKVYADQINAVVVKIGEDAKVNAGAFEGVYKTITDKLTETANELKAKNPDLATYQATLENSLKQVITETQKFSKKLEEDGKGVSENLNVALKQIYENTLSTAQDVSATVAKAVKKD